MDQFQDNHAVEHGQDNEENRRPQKRPKQTAHNGTAQDAGEQTGRERPTEGAGAGQEGREDDRPIEATHEQRQRQHGNDGDANGRRAQTLRQGFRQHDVAGLQGGKEKQAQRLFPFLAADAIGANQGDPQPDGSEEELMELGKQFAAGQGGTGIGEEGNGSEQKERCAEKPDAVSNGVTGFGAQFAFNDGKNVHSRQP